MRTYEGPAAEQPNFDFNYISALAVNPAGTSLAVYGNAIRDVWSIETPELGSSTGFLFTVSTEDGRWTSSLQKLTHHQ